MTNILYFTAAWCGPCKMFRPVVDEVSRETGRLVNVIDVDQNKALAQQYGVMSVPTIVIEEGGVVKQKFTGAQPKAMLTRLFSGS